jgi:hypothetical protein
LNSEIDSSTLLSIPDTRITRTCAPSPYFELGWTTCSFILKRAVVTTLTVEFFLFRGKQSAGTPTMNFALRLLLTTRWPFTNRGDNKPNGSALNTGVSFSEARESAKELHC